MSERAQSRGDRRRLRRVIVVGSGVSGMSAALELARAGTPVLLLGRTPALRSGSVCHKDGIAAAFGQGAADSVRDHFAQSLQAGDFAANQAPLRALCEAAPRLIAGLDRIGVPFERTPEGRIARLRVAGSEAPRAAHAGACTAEQVLRALDRELVRREATDAVDARGAAVAGEALVSRLVPWEFLGIVRDDNGVCVGVVAADLRSGKIRAFVGDAVCLATGGFGALWSGSCADAWSDGAAIARVFRQGALLANPEYVAWQPTALPGLEKALALPEAARALGARLYVDKDPRDHFLERAFPKSRGLVWADEAARSVWRAERRALEGAPAVLLDLAPVASRGELGDLFDALGRVTNADARGTPIPVAARAEASLGGLWVDYEADGAGRLVAASPRNHATNIAGFYAAGSAEYQYHGANRLPGNALAASLFAGWLAARGIVSYRQALAKSAFDLPASIFEKAESREQASLELRARAAGESAENPFVVRDAIAELVASSCGLERDDETLDAAASDLDALAARAELAGVEAPFSDPALRVAHALPSLVTLARAVVLGARRRDECRGGHNKPILDRRRSRGAPERGAPKTTLVTLGADDLPQTIDAFDYTCAGAPVHVSSDVDVSLVAPRAREDAEGLAEDDSEPAPEEVE